MNFNEKYEFLTHAKELARNLEDVTNTFIEIQIGWIEDIPVTIMINHNTRWFGSFEHSWNEIVIWNSINDFVPVKEDYLALNELINKTYDSI